MHLPSLVKIHLHVYNIQETIIVWKRKYGQMGINQKDRQMDKQITNVKLQYPATILWWGIKLLFQYYLRQSVLENRDYSSRSERFLFLHETLCAAPWEKNRCSLCK